MPFFVGSNELVQHRLQLGMSLDYLWFHVFEVNNLVWCIGSACCSNLNASIIVFQNIHIAVAFGRHYLGAVLAHTNAVGGGRKFRPPVGAGTIAGDTPEVWLVAPALIIFDVSSMAIAMAEEQRLCYDFSIIGDDHVMRGGNCLLNPCGIWWWVPGLAVDVGFALGADVYIAVVMVSIVHGEGARGHGLRLQCLYRPVCVHFRGDYTF